VCDSTPKDVAWLLEQLPWLRHLTQRVAGRMAMARLRIITGEMPLANSGWQWGEIVVCIKILSSPPCSPSFCRNSSMGITLEEIVAVSHKRKRKVRNRHPKQLSEEAIELLHRWLLSTEHFDFREWKNLCLIVLRSAHALCIM
jgi:hypothetical protein